MKLHRLVAPALASLGLLVACGQDDGATAPDTGITLSGSVRDFAGEPIGGATVLVFGKGAVTSGSDGRFSIAGVPVPYDIGLILVADNAAVIYKGVTRSDPILQSPYFSLPEKSATISGTTPPAASPDTETLVLFVSGRVRWTTVADPTTGAYEMTVRWRTSANTRAGQLYVLRWMPTVASYDGYASRPLTITAGENHSDNDFAEDELVDPPEQSIGGAVVVPSEYTVKRQWLFLTFGSQPVSIALQHTTHPAFTYTVPDVIGMTFGVAAYAEDPYTRWSFSFKGGISGNTANVSVPLDAAAQLSSPPDGATGVGTSTPFGWSPGGGTAVNIVEVIPDHSTNAVFLVLTTGADARIPDLGAHGMSLPAAAGYRWYVNRISPVASIDDVAGDGFLPLLYLEAGDAGQTVSERFRFTTAGAAPSALQAPAAAQARDGERPLWTLTPGAPATRPR